MPASPALPFATRLVPALVAAALLSACGKGESADAHGGGGMPPTPTVVYQEATAHDVPLTFEYVGQTAGSREVEIRARVSGIVEKRLFEEGSRVRAGQRLFLLDSAPFAAQANAAEAELATAEARLKQAERDYQRLKPLIEAKAVSQKEFDDASSAQDLARAAVKAAQARLQSTRVDLGYTEVRAPMAGVIGRAAKVEGSLANAQGDSLLATLAQTDPIHVNFVIPENDHNKLQAELAAGTIKQAPGGYTVRLKTSTGQTLKPSGRVDFNDYKADPNTGAYASRAEFPNSDNTLSPGQFVRVTLSGVYRPNVVAIPQRAVLDGPTGKFVYVVGNKDGKTVAAPRPVVVGEWVKLEGSEANSWLIKQGLAAGDKVIVDGVKWIFYPFQEVKPMSVEQAAAAAKAPKQQPADSKLQPAT
ncbi:efflux RND transporter periplasmic adaptor subunit [Chitinimonas lacunae]|uniref:Efflux RND transporter periplasmic adaptor subunit n=1 Tax=Chitinimonas lacunae TaxID=1963018 RepID=A0ABV8ML61_9NEIS